MAPGPFWIRDWHGVDRLLLSMSFVPCTLVYSLERLLKPVHIVF